MRIGIDLDGCGYPFAEEFRRYASSRLRQELPPHEHWNSHQKHWGLSHDQMKELMIDALLDGKLWSAGEPEEGFMEASWALAEAGHKIVIATDRLQQEAPNLAKLARETTRTWLRRNMVNYDELLFTADKRDAHADIFIDDRPQAVPTLRLDGVDAVYFSRPWNAGFPYPRVHSWAEFVEFVERAASVQAG